MQIVFRKHYVPWIMAAVRAALGPIVVAGQACQWSGIALASMIVAALLSDIFDGVLARQWKCDTAAVRLLSSEDRECANFRRFYSPMDIGGLWVLGVGGGLTREFCAVLRQGRVSCCRVRGSAELGAKRFERGGRTGNGRCQCRFFACSEWKDKKRRQMEKAWTQKSGGWPVWASVSM